MAYAYPEDVHRLYIISYGIPVCPQGSQISANLMKSFKMTNFAPCGPIFKIRNSKQVYSKSYNQISDCIFLKPAISRQTSCKQIKSLIANLKSCLKVPCVPTVQCSICCSYLIQVTAITMCLPTQEQSLERLISLIYQHKLQAF